MKVCTLSFIFSNRCLCPNRGSIGSTPIKGITITDIANGGRMIKLVILLMIFGLVLVGCIDKKTEKDNNVGNTNVTENTSAETNISDNNANVTDGINIPADNIETDNDNVETDSDTDISSGWCDAGVMITVHGEEFTIKGIVTYQGREVCQAEQISGNNKKIRYFSQDGKFVSEIATSSSTSGNASASSQASVTTNR